MSFDATIDLSEQSEDEQSSGRYYLGKVVEVSTDGSACVKVHVPGLYEPNEGAVPWVGPVRHSVFGIGANFGFYGAPQVGANVTVILQEGNPQYPLYVGSVLKAAEVPGEFKNPNVWGFQDPKGNKLIVNLQSGEFKFVHNTGATLLFSENGEVTISATKIHLNP